MEQQYIQMVNNALGRDRRSVEVFNIQQILTGDELRVWRNR